MSGANGHAQNATQATPAAEGLFRQEVPGFLSSRSKNWLRHWKCRSIPRSNRTFVLKQAVLLYQDGNRAFATLHEVKHRPNEPPYLCAGQSVTTGFLETLAKGLGASMAAEVLPEQVLARTPELIAWGSRARPRLMFFGEGNAETRALNGKMYPHPALVFMIQGRECARTRRELPTECQYATL